MGAWLLIERTETCDRLFDWIAENPNYEIDSMMMAFIIASLGVNLFGVRRFAELREALVRRRRAEQRAHDLAYHDALTGLPNRHALNERLDALPADGRTDRTISLLLIDLDRFKAVNDVHGHLAGDQLLRMAAWRLTGCLRRGQAVYRRGGDEFALMCEFGPEDHDMPQRLARRVVEVLSEPFEDSGLVHHIGASVGIALFPDNATDRETLLRRADIALYCAKQNGRGHHLAFESTMDADIIRRARIEKDLRLAIAADELRPFYQPVVDLASGRTIGFEMLARWPRRDGQAIGPDEFIPIAQECGLINDLLFQLLARALHDARAWDPEIRLAINIAPVQLKDHQLVPKVLEILGRADFPPQRLIAEITETALIDDTDGARRILEAFNLHGIQVALDDFGTGYSSLHHLRLLPFDQIKIDRSFVQGIETSPEAAKIVRAITNLAASMDLPVVAEGIESQTVAVRLQEFGCVQGQGYHYGRPMPGGQIVATSRPSQAEVSPPRPAH